MATPESSALPPARPIWCRPSPSPASSTPASLTTGARHGPMPLSPAAPPWMPSPGARTAAAPPASATSAGRPGLNPLAGACDIGAYEVEVPGQPLSAWVTGLTPHTAVCENVTTGHAVTLSAPGSPWDCEAAGLAVRRGTWSPCACGAPSRQRAADVGGAVVGMAPRGGGCTNRTTGQQVKFEALFQGEPGRQRRAVWPRGWSCSRGIRCRCACWGSRSNERCPSDTPAGTRQGVTAGGFSPADWQPPPGVRPRPPSLSTARKDEPP